MTELDLQRELLIAAPRELPTLRLFRRNIVNATSAFGVRMRAGIKGQCDLYGVVRGGRHLEIELKSATGSLRAEQKAWRAWCVQWGVPYALLEGSKLETTEETVGRWLSELRAFL
jgi:hypothetical protein